MATKSNPNNQKAQREHAYAQAMSMILKAIESDGAIDPIRTGDHTFAFLAQGEDGEVKWENWAEIEITIKMNKSRRMKDGTIILPYDPYFENESWKCEQREKEDTEEE